MEPIKIYLSKSKSGNIDDILKIKKVLSKYENIEILEFEGGEYNTDKLKEADIVLIIPPTLPKPCTDTFTIGKGQYSEAVAANFSVLYVISYCSEEINVVSEYALTLNVIDDDWKTRFAEIEYDLDEIEHFIDFSVYAATGENPILRTNQKHDPFSFAPIALENTEQNAIQNTVFAKPMLALYKKQ
jgi:hypothetical protein